MTATAKAAREHPLKHEFGYFADFLSSPDIPMLRARINGAIRELELSEFAYIRLDNPGTGNLQLLLNTFPEELVFSYATSGCFEHDMTREKAKGSTAAYFSSTIHDYLAEAPFTSDMTSGMNAILELNQSFGFYDFYNIPIVSGNLPSQALLSVTQRGASPAELETIVRGRESTLRLISEAIEAVVTQNFPAEIIGNRPGKLKRLSRNSKPLRVLSTLANNDYSISQVAKKLSISVVTVNQHLKTVRNRLGTKTNYAAIKQAVQSNLIDYKQQPSYVKKVDEA